MRIASHTIYPPLICAPMAGVSDLPFRTICKKFSAGMAVSEMITSQAHLYTSHKTQKRLAHSQESSPIVVQIVGADPNQLATAAQFNRDNGADIIDINMGCPAKKVFNKAAGSALLAEPKLVEAICQTVVKSVRTPVTIKIRTGITPEKRNAVEIAKIAEQCGIQAITVHGRSKACKFKGKAEYNTIAQVKNAVSIPVIANGDIDCPEKALEVLRFTQADGIMIGRAAQGRPWIFQEIAHAMYPNDAFQPIHFSKKVASILEHIHAIHSFYGEYAAIRMARKHIKWYLTHLGIETASQTVRKLITLQSSQQQLRLLSALLMQHTPLKAA